MNETAPKNSRTFGGAIAIVGLSLTPLLIAIVIIRVKAIADLLAYLLYLVFLAVGYLAGSRWHNFVRLDNDNSLDPVDAPQPNKRLDWLALVTALIVGFGVVLLLRCLTTHEVARAFGHVMSGPSDE